MSTIPTDRRKTAVKALGGTLTVAACVIIAVRWSEVLAGLSLAVAIFAWLTPRGLRR
jgi:hypothetical protein